MKVKKNKTIQIQQIKETTYHNTTHN